MNTESRRDRLQELLADRALVGLSEAEMSELRQLRGEFSGEDDELSLEWVAANLQVGLGLSSWEEMPEAVRDRLRLRGEAFLRERRENPDWISEVGVGDPTTGEERSDRPDSQRIRSIPRGSRPGISVGWLAAAAAAVIAMLGWWPRLDRADPAELRQQLIVEAPDLVRGEWTALQPLAAESVSGDTIWSNQRQEGYLRFQGLQVNDPTKEQYQLWIIDDDQKHPIDGGVFDIESSRDVIVPIDAKIRVARPQKFAVTIEKPGGVVVSDQERLILLAEVG